MTHGSVSGWDGVCLGCFLGFAKIRWSLQKHTAIYSGHKSLCVIFHFGAIKQAALFCSVDRHEEDEDDDSHCRERLSLLGGDQGD